MFAITDGTAASGLPVGRRARIGGEPITAGESAAYLDDGVTPVASGVVPGQIIRFRFTVTNGGATSASTVQVTDALPAQVTYVSTSSSAGWTVAVVGQNVTATYTGTGGVLAASANATFELRVSIN